MEYCFRPRHSKPFGLGCNLHYFERAQSLQADTVILDLCDPIFIEAKIQSRVTLAARAYGRCVIDGIASDFKNMHSFEYACRMDRDIGCNGKSLIHPVQIAYRNDAHMPKANEVTNALNIIKAPKKAQASGHGTVVINDRLVGNHNAKAAERLIKLSEMITKLEAEYV